MLDFQAAVAITSKFLTSTRQGVALFTFMWKDDIERGLFESNEFNVYGASPNGTNHNKRPLNAHKVAILRKFIEDKMEHGVNKAQTWGKVVTAIHKRLSYLGKLGNNGYENEDDEEDLDA